MKYRKKPVVVEAVKYDKSHIGKALDFCDELKYNPNDNEYYVQTLEGAVKVFDGDYIIKGVEGEFYICREYIFLQTYEEVKANEVKKEKNMKYKEFKDEIEDWGKNYNYKPIVGVGCNYIYMEVETEEGRRTIFDIDKSERFVLDLDWKLYRDLSDDAKRGLFEIATEFAATPIKEREDEKRFIVPLPRLVTTDGKQQYLTHKAHKGCNFFASRRDKDLRQIWQEDELKFLPELYRQFAVEFDEEKEY